MKILKAAHLGMCFGVRDAIAAARAEARREPVTVFGPLVHNPGVVRDLARRGVRVVEAPEQAGAGTVLITAHGASERAKARLARHARRVVETTCPLVRRAHQALAELVAGGCHPVVIGRRGHVEVRGLTEDLPECDVILTEDDVNALRERPRFGVVAQTTQPVERVERLVAALRRRFPRAEVRFRNTVCRPTRDRQRAAVALARRCTVMVVLGGANSNNTRELAAACARFCARVHRVEAVADLRPEWFRADDVVGLTAGTSTPDEAIAAVERWLRRLAARAAPTRAVWKPGKRRQPGRVLTPAPAR